MKCPQCKLVEMFVIRVKDNVAEYKCKQCGTTEKVEIPQEESN